MILQILLGILGLGIVVFFHELGHLLGAKLCGIEVEVFSIGWGKKLIGRTWRGTEYRISMLPLGGFCKMKGEHPVAPSDHPGEDGQDEVQESSGRGLYEVSPPRRIVTYLAGPIGNLIFTLLTLTLVWQIGFAVYTYPSRIVIPAEHSSVENIDSPARQGGMLSGDLVVSVDGREITNFEELRDAILPNPNTPLEITVNREGQLISLTVSPELDRGSGIGYIGVLPWVTPVVASVLPDSPSEIAGLEVGDLIVSVDGIPVQHSLEFDDAVARSQSGVVVEVERSGQVKSVRLIPHGDGVTSTHLGIGFATVEYPSPELNPVQSLMRGVGETVETIVLSVKGLINLPRSGVPLNRAISGPVRITYFIGNVASSGFAAGFRQGTTSFLRFLSFISIALFIMNLLPIPILDGGMILLNLISWVMRRPIASRYIKIFQMAGSLFIIMLLLFATYGDIVFLSGQ